jgi:hypothetical protein
MGFRGGGISWGSLDKRRRVWYSICVDFRLSNCRLAVGLKPDKYDETVMLAGGHMGPPLQAYFIV